MDKNVLYHSYMSSQHGVELNIKAALLSALIYKDSTLSIFTAKWLELMFYKEIQEFNSLNKLMAQYHRLGNNYELPKKKSANLLDLLQQWSAS
jgi:hypothetical protein